MTTVFRMIEARGSRRALIRESGEGEVQEEREV
jgi:hypothetical protein